MIEQILISILISVAVYLGLAICFIIFGKPAGDPDPSLSPSLKELFFDYSGLPDLKAYQARDGSRLDYRHYPADSGKTLILIHGSGWHSRYLLKLAKAIADSGAARVYTPDLRGHGVNPARRGDVDYEGQLVDDLADFIGFVKERHPGTKVILGGHSLGGGLTVRFGGGRYGGLADAYILLAPFLKHNAPTTRRDAGGWARPYILRIVGLSMLNFYGIRLFNNLTVIDFNMPLEARDGTETLKYSHRLSNGLAPRNYKKDLAAMHQPLLVLVGAEDQSFFADKYRLTITRYTEATVEVFPGITHMSLVTSTLTGAEIADWLVKDSADKITG